MSIPLRRSIYDAQVAKLRSKYPGKLGDEAVAAYGEGFDVRSDSDAIFKPAQEAAAARQRATAQSGLYEAAARIVELTGVSPAEALKRAELAQSVRNGTLEPQNRDEAVEAMRQAIEDDPSILQRDGHDVYQFTDEDGEAMLAAQEARFQRKAHERLAAQAEDLRLRLRDAGLGEDDVEASVNGFLVKNGTTPGAFRRAEAELSAGGSKAIEDMTAADLRASMKALPASAFGAGDEG